MTIDLEQIAKQVSLLKRLLELLRMQEEPESDKLQNYFPTDRGLISKHSGKVFVRLSRWAQKKEKNWHLYGKELEFSEAWNHFLIQEWWSDELVKVARELINTGRLEMGLAFVFIELFEKDDWKEGLEAILNKYGRSLSE